MQMNPYRRVENNIYCVKTKGESDPAGGSVWRNLNNSAYTTHGIKRAGAMTGLCQGTGEPEQVWEAKMPQAHQG